MKSVIFTLLIISVCVIFGSCSSYCISVPTVKQSETFIGKIPYGTDYKTIWIKPGTLFYYIKFSLVINSQFDFQGDKEHRDNLVINSPAISFYQWSNIRFRILRTIKTFSADIYTLEATLNWHSKFTKAVSLWSSMTSIKYIKVYVSGDSEISFDCRPIETTTTTTTDSTTTLTTASASITTTTSTSSITTASTSSTTITSLSITPALTSTTATTSIPATSASLTAHVTPISSAGMTSPSTHFSESNVPNERSSTSIPFETAALLTSSPFEAPSMPTIMMPITTDLKSEREANTSEIAILASNNTIQLETSTILLSLIGTNTTITRYDSTTVHSSTATSNINLPFTFITNTTAISNTRLDTDFFTTDYDEFTTEKSNSFELNPRNTTHTLISVKENTDAFIIISLIPTLTLLCGSLLLMVICIASHYKGKMEAHRGPNVECINQRTLKFQEFSRKINADSKDNQNEEVWQCVAV